MALLYWMNYTFVFRNHDEYLIALAITGGTGSMQIAPNAAGQLFGLGNTFADWPTGDVSQVPLFGYFGFPYSPGYNIGFPNPSGVVINGNDLSYNVPCQPGSPPSTWPCPGDGSHDAIFTWALCIAFQGSFSNGQQIPPPAANPIPQRRWIGGFETTTNLEGGTAATTTSWSRDASRTIDGIGLAMRGTQMNPPYTKTTNQYRTGLNPPTSWERFYVRFRRLGTGTGPVFWRCQGFPTSANGSVLRWNADGTVHSLDATQFSGERDKGVVFTPAINDWYKIDILLKYGVGPLSTGVIRIYVNGVFALTYSVSDSIGMSNETYHASSQLGSLAGQADWEIDLDDWMCADLPANIDASTLVPNDNNFPIDWLMGSHMKLFTIDPSAGSSTNWTGTRAAANQPWNPLNSLTNQLTSSTALARIELLSNIPPLNVLAMDPTFAILGIASAVVGLFSKNSLNTDGQLGYRKAGGGDTLVTVDQVSGGSATSAAYFPTGLDLPEEVSPFSLVHIKSNDANLDTTYAVTVVAEQLGVFGPEDDPTFVMPVERLGFVHNSPWAETIFGLVFNDPAAPVYAVGGTYTGNGTFNKVTLPAPCNWLWIRGTTVATSPIMWWSSMVAPHHGQREKIISGLRFGFDGTDYFFEVSGQGADINQNAVTYQYIAFCDPGARFMLNTSIYHSTGSTTPVANPLFQPGFLPDISFASIELADTTSNTDRAFLKGPANAGTTAQPFAGGASVADFGSFVAGIFNSGATLNPSSGDCALSLWRMTEPGCTGTMIQVLTYTGNGTNPRNIPLTPVSGRFPLFVMVTPANAGGFFRDPSHTGTNSASLGNLANSTLAITAVAVDQITVNSSLNANGVVYQVFAICGDSAAMNNGAFTNLFCDNPAGPQSSNPPFPANEPNVIGDGGIILNGSAPLTLLKDISGIYTLIPNQRHDTLYDRQTNQTNVDVEIPDPTFKTGYIGG